MRKFLDILGIVITIGILIFAFQRFFPNLKFFPVGLQNGRFTSAPKAPIIRIMGRRIPPNIKYSVKFWYPDAPLSMPRYGDFRYEGYRSVYKNHLVVLQPADSLINLQELIGVNFFYARRHWQTNNIRIRLDEREINKKSIILLYFYPQRDQD